MKTIYQLNLAVNGKLVQFNMNVDGTLKPSTKIDDNTANKWRNRLQAVANSMFGENNDVTT